MSNGTKIIQRHSDHQNVARIRNLPAPANPDEPVRLQDMNSAVEGLSWKDSVRVSTAGNISIASPGATLDGVTMAVNDRVLLRAQTAAAENGIYIWNGGAVAMTRSADANTADELEAATVSVEEGTAAGSTFRQTSVNFVLGTGAVNWTAFGTSAPAASTTTAGIVQLATATEVNTGTATDRAVTPAALAGSTRGHQGATLVMGDGTATAFSLAHGFNSLNVLATVRRNTAPFDDIEVDIERTDANTVRAVFLTAPTTNQFVLMVVRV